MFYIIAAIILGVVELSLIKESRYLYSRSPMIFMIIQATFIVILLGMHLLHTPEVFSFYLWVMLILNITFISILVFYMIQVRHFKDSNAQNVDYIIVCGNRVMSNHLPPNLRGRLDKAIFVYNKLSEKPKIIVSGGHKSSFPESEAEMMKKYLLENNISSSSIVMEERSLNTIQNLEFSAIAINNDWEQETSPEVMIVSSEFHIPRIKCYALNLHWKVRYAASKTMKILKWPAMYREFTAIIWYYRFTIFTFLVMIFIILISTLGR